MTVTITSTHYVYLRRDGQAGLAWVVWLYTETVYPLPVTHLSTNLTRRRVTSLILDKPNNITTKSNRQLS